MLGGLAIAGILVYLALDVALVFLRPQFSVLHNAESDYRQQRAIRVGSATHGLGRMHLALAFIAFAAVIAGSRAARADPVLRSYATVLTVLAYGALVPILKIFLAIELLWLSLVSWSSVSARAGRPPPVSVAA